MAGLQLLFEVEQQRARKPVFRVSDLIDDVPGFLPGEPHLDSDLSDLPARQVLILKRVPFGLPHLLGYKLVHQRADAGLLKVSQGVPWAHALQLVGHLRDRLCQESLGLLRKSLRNYGAGY